MIALRMMSAIPCQNLMMVSPGFAVTRATVILAQRPKLDFESSLMVSSASLQPVFKSNSRP